MIFSIKRFNGKFNILKDVRQKTHPFYEFKKIIGYFVSGKKREFLCFSKNKIKYEKVKKNI